MNYVFVIFDLGITVNMWITESEYTQENIKDREEGIVWDREELHDVHTYGSKLKSFSWYVQAPSAAHNWPAFICARTPRANHRPWSTILLAVLVLTDIAEVKRGTRKSMNYQQSYNSEQELVQGTRKSLISFYCN